MHVGAPFRNFRGPNEGSSKPTRVLRLELVLYCFQIQMDLMPDPVFDPRWRFGVVPLYCICIFGFISSSFRYSCLRDQAFTIHIESANEANQRRVIHATFHLGR